MGRALVLAGKLGQKSAEEIYRKASSGRTSFIAELTGSGAVSASDLAHTMSSAYAAPLVENKAITGCVIASVYVPHTANLARGAKERAAAVAELEAIAADALATGEVAA